MNIKEIVEGMTAPQVAQVIKDNFNEVDKDKANKTDLNKSISDLASVVEANKTDLTKKIDNNKEDTDEKLSELGSEIVKFAPAINLNKLTPIKVVNNAFINSDGAKSEIANVEYAIYDISSFDNIMIYLENYNLSGATVWATYSQLLNNDISSDYLINNIVAPFHKIEAPYYCIITKGDANYLAVSQDSTKKSPFDYVGATSIYKGKGISDIQKEVTNIQKAFLKEVPISFNYKVIGKYISSDGSEIEAQDMQYIVWNVKGCSSIRVRLNKNALWGAPIWATFSESVIPSNLVETHIGTQDEQHKFYEVDIAIEKGVNYIAINNTIEYWNEGYGVYNITENYYIPSENYLTNKKIVIMGDSITWQGGEECDNPIGWTKWFKDKIKPLSCKSYAWSGATWTNYATTNINNEPPLYGDSDNVVWQQIRRLINNVQNENEDIPDIIIIAAGLNDVGCMAKGLLPANIFDKSVEQTFADLSKYTTDKIVTEVVTMADSIRYGCELLIEAFPNVQIILCTPLQAVDYYINEDLLNKSRAIIKECGRYLSCPVVEQDKVCGIYRVQETLSNYNLKDGVHPTERGAKKIGNILASHILSVAL